MFFFVSSAIKILLYFCENRMMMAEDGGDLWLDNDDRNFFFLFF